MPAPNRRCTQLSDFLRKEQFFAVEDDRKTDERDGAVRLQMPFIHKIVVCGIRFQLLLCHIKKRRFRFIRHRLRLLDVFDLDERGVGDVREVKEARRCFQLAARSLLSALQAR